MNIPTLTLLKNFEHPSNDEQERLRLVLLGSGEWITQTIHQLHHLGFAQVGDWSPLIPSPEGELLSILIRQRSR
jgi:hypothetical protein